MDRIMTRTSIYSGIACWALAVGCSSQAADSAKSPLATSDASDCTQSGASACSDAITAMCSRFTQCCATITTCESWAKDMTTCKAHWVETGLDCSSPTYAGKTVCESLTTECQQDIPTIACSDAANGTANWPASCATFWNQFQ